MNKKSLAALWQALLWSIVIFILLIIPGQNIPTGPKLPSLDKVVHVILFGIQVLLWCRFIEYTRTSYIPLKFLLVFLLSGIFGIAMEFVQKYWVTNRSFETEDILADIFGSAMGWLIYYYFYIRRKRTV